MRMPVQPLFINSMTNELKGECIITLNEAEGPVKIVFGMNSMRLAAKLGNFELGEFSKFLQSHTLDWPGYFIAGALQDYYFTNEQPDKARSVDVEVVSAQVDKLPPEQVKSLTEAIKNSQFLGKVMVLAQSAKKVTEPEPEK